MAPFSQMDKVTQTNAANAEESAAAAESLRHEAENLRSAITELQHLVDGGNCATGATITGASLTPREAVWPVNGAIKDSGLRPSVTLVEPRWERNTSRARVG